jgi:hypothetical protein
MWEWFGQSFVPVVFPEDPKDAPFTINLSNRLVGGIRMVQWRVKSDAKTASTLDKTGQKCLPDFSTSYEDTSYFIANASAQSDCASNSGSVKDAPAGCMPGFYFVSQTALENAESHGRVQTNYPSRYACHLMFCHCCAFSLMLSTFNAMLNFAVPTS